jgi:hypothetical protein
MADNRITSEANVEQTLPLMPGRSRYAGQPIDVSSRRSIEIEPPIGERELTEPAGDQVSVVYFYREGEFWKGGKQTGPAGNRGTTADHSHWLSGIGRHGPGICRHYRVCVARVNR